MERNRVRASRLLEYLTPIPTRRVLTEALRLMILEPFHVQQIGLVRRNDPADEVFSFTDHSIHPVLSLLHIIRRSLDAVEGRGQMKSINRTQEPLEFPETDPLSDLHGKLLGRRRHSALLCEKKGRIQDHRDDHHVMEGKREGEGGHCLVSRGRVVAVTACGRGVKQKGEKGGKGRQRVITQSRPCIPILTQGILKDVCMLRLHIELLHNVCLLNHGYEISFEHCDYYREA